LKVVNAEDGEPIEGAEVELLDGSSDRASARPQRRVMMFSITTSDNGDGGEATSMTMGGARAETDVDGRVEIDAVPPGRYVVRVRHRRHAQRDVPDQVVLENATTDCGTVELAAAGGVRGRVVDASGAAVQLAMVTCRKVGDDGEPQRQPAMMGSFSFDGLSSGRYALQAQALDGPGPDGPSGPEIEVDVTAGKTTSGVEVRVAPG
jgi:hypothetical protein